MKTTKVFIIFSFILLAFTAGDIKNEYLLPDGAKTVSCYDIDLDGDLDIITGHNSSTWIGCNILLNDSTGLFPNTDSIFFTSGLPDVKVNYFDNNSVPDIFSVSHTQDPYSINISVIYNYAQTQFDSIKSFYIYNDGPTPNISCGDVNGDGYVDLLMAHNNNMIWGILYNDGTGNFSYPEYHSLTYTAAAINSADLNGDGLDEVIIGSMNIEVFYYTETGFESLQLGQPQLLTGGRCIQPSDFDNDGDIDIIFTSMVWGPKTRVFFYENIGNNQFSQHPYFDFTPLCTFSHMADFNNDSLPDIVFIEWLGENLQVYMNKENFQLGGQILIPITSVAFYGLSTGDLDFNGFNDIAVIKFAPSSVLKIFFNDGQGNFVDDPITSINNGHFNKEIAIKGYPNPFKIQTTLKFTIEENSKVELLVFDLSGKLIISLINNNLNRGTHLIKWNGTDLTGQACNPGSYIAFLKVNNKALQTIKLLKI